MKKDGLPEKAEKIMNDLKYDLKCYYEDKDTIGRRYRRQDAAGTPFCLTIDHQTLEDDTVTIRDRDIPLAGYTTIDVSAGYSWKKISLLCKVSNITNELNYTVHENYSVNPIPPRQVLANLTYRF